MAGSVGGTQLPAAWPAGTGTGCATSIWKLTCGRGLSPSALGPRTQKPGLPGRTEDGRALPYTSPRHGVVTQDPQLSTRPAGSGGLLPCAPFLDGRPPRAAPEGSSCTRSPCPGWPPAPAVWFRTRSSLPGRRPGRRRLAWRPPPVQRAPGRPCGEAHVPDGPPDGPPQGLSGAEQRPAGLLLLLLPGDRDPWSRAFAPRVLVTGAPVLQQWGPPPKNDR